MLIRRLPRNTGMPAKAVMTAEPRELHGIWLDGIIGLGFRFRESSKSGSR